MPPEAEPFDPSASLQALAEGGVDFVVIGGVAGGGYGSSYGTFDLDLVGIRGVGSTSARRTGLRRPALALSQEAAKGPSRS